MLVIHVLGFFAVFVTIWVLGNQSLTKEVWTQFGDYEGWGSYGLAMLVGSNGASVTLLGSDAAAHLAEELKDASWTLPRSMIATAAANYSLTFLVLVSK
jgi:choline transport protein